jgi:Carbohydrate binding module (family 6)
MKNKLFFLSICLINLNLLAQNNYKGKPWNDTFQIIPGKLECEKYDLGGENIAFHDKDSLNNGSGKLNPNDGTFYNTFRIKEGVDISYTKARDIDNNPYNFVEPQMEQLYVGWTEAGEWIKYSIEVNETGKYEGTLMYTANADAKIAIDIDEKPWLDPVLIKSTFNEKDPIAWRQWHHWNKQVIFSSLKLTKGKHILTLKTVEKGNMNYDFIDFKKVK